MHADNEFDCIIQWMTTFMKLKGQYAPLRSEYDAPYIGYILRRYQDSGPGL